MDCTLELGSGTTAHGGQNQNRPRTIPSISHRDNMNSMLPYCIVR